MGAGAGRGGKVMKSGETKIELYGHQRKGHVWCKPHTSHHPESDQRSEKTCWHVPSQTGSQTDDVIQPVQTYLKPTNYPTVLISNWCRTLRLLWYNFTSAESHGLIRSTNHIQVGKKKNVRHHYCEAFRPPLDRSSPPQAESEGKCKNL